MGRCWGGGPAGPVTAAPPMGRQRATEATKAAPTWGRESGGQGGKEKP